MRLALAAVLACVNADNATNPLPKAAALLEAANKLRAEAAALETQAQAEAVALESARVEHQKAAAAATLATTPPPVNTSEPTPAPTTPAPTPWIARPFRTRREDNRTTCSTTVDQCRAAYPDLLRRIDWDLAPWRLNGGITPNATQRRYDEAVGNGDQLAISVRGGRAHVQRWGRGYKSRTVTAQNMITRSLERVCGVPSVSKFVYTTSDHAPPPDSKQAGKAPLGIWCRRADDPYSVAAPEGSFLVNGDNGNTPMKVNATAHALEMARHAPPWKNRTDKLWFRGQIWRGGGNDARRAVAQFLRGNHPDGNPWADVLDIAEGGVGAHDQCTHKYLLYLHGSACSGRLKNLLRCGSLVVFPRSAGGVYNAPDKHGRGYGQGIAYEEFFYHRLVLENETVVRPGELVDLLPWVGLLRRYDDASRRIGEAARARATRELSVEAAMCYWAVLLAEVGALQRRGGFSF